MLIEFVALFGLNVDDITLKTCCPSVAIAVVLFKLVLPRTAGFELRYSILYLQYFTSLGPKALDYGA